jgi:hypothetical protein
MHPNFEIERQMANERVEALRRAGRRGRGEATAAVVIRASRADESGALAELALLDDADLPAGPALVAEVNGSIQAALPLEGGRAIADPFRRTSDLVELLEERASQIRRASGRRHRFALHAPAALRRLV